MRACRVRVSATPWTRVRLVRTSTALPSVLLTDAVGALTRAVTRRGVRVVCTALARSRAGRVALCPRVSVASERCACVRAHACAPTARHVCRACLHTARTSVQRMRACCAMARWVHVQLRLRSACVPRVCCRSRARRVAALRVHRHPSHHTCAASVRLRAVFAAWVCGVCNTLCCCRLCDRVGRSEMCGHDDGSGRIPAGLAGFRPDASDCGSQRSSRASPRLSTRPSHPVQSTPHLPASTLLRSPHLSFSTASSSSVAAPFVQHRVRIPSADSRSTCGAHCERTARHASLPPLHRRACTHRAH